VSVTVQRAGRASASGKVILLGEHVVVHGHPAIVAGLGRGLSVTIAPGDGPPSHDVKLGQAITLAARLVGVAPDGFTVAIDGDLPIGMGLGSSAALAVALLRALAAAGGIPLGTPEVAAAAHEIERLFHGTPSGVDSTAAAHGGVLWFEAGPPPRHQRLTLPRALPLLVVLSRTTHTTAQTVGSLRERAAAAPEVYQPVFTAIADLVRSARAALERDDRGRLGALMTMNHRLLQACGVSTPELDALVDSCLAAGALGAKLTGAGGGGAVIALPPDDGAALAAALGRAGHEALAVQITSDGARS
jgi:hydroxymethylglutaryl-CoA reductase